MRALFPLSASSGTHYPIHPKRSNVPASAASRISSKSKTVSSSVYAWNGAVPLLLQDRTRRRTLFPVSEETA
jgi:hypothetical protein